MAKIFLNRSIAKDGTYSLKNGATRRLLLVINKINKDIECNVPFQGSIGTLEKGNASFIFVNEEKRKDDRIIFVFTDNGYGVSFHNEAPIFSATSIGGYGNSESTIAILNEGTLIECNSYKNRTESDFYLTDKEQGFVKVSLEEAISMLHSEDIQEI